MSIGINANSSYFPPMKPVGGGGTSDGGCGAHDGGGPDVPATSINGSTTTLAGLQDMLGSLDALAANGGAYAGGPFSSVLAGYGPGDPGLAAASPMASERFVQSTAGGVILDADGAPAGSVPAGSFLDARTGTVYGPDSKALALPEGASVDFFDLPDTAMLRQEYALGSSEPGAPGATTTAAGGPIGLPGQRPPMKYPGIGNMFNHHATPTGGAATVGGKWGPGAPGTTSAPGKTVPVSAGGLTTPAAYASPVHGGGLVGGANGAGQIGSAPTLESSLASLIETLQQLAMALSMGSVVAGGPGQSAPYPIPFPAPGQFFPGQRPGQYAAPPSVPGIPAPPAKPVAPPEQVVDVGVGSTSGTEPTAPVSPDDSAAAAAASGDESTSAGGSSAAEPATDSSITGGGGVPVAPVDVDNADAADDGGDEENVAAGANNA